MLTKKDIARYKIRESGRRFINLTISFSLLIILLPFLAIIALLVALTSPGPVIFKQKRLGKGGKPFTLYKFRTMVHNFDQTIHKNFVAKAISKESRNQIYRIDLSPYITPVGKWLRKLSLDELPQFFNVLLGDMNIVGPRPLPIYEAEYFNEWHWQRQQCKPGITGLYQVKARGAVPFDEMVKLDIQYIKRTTLWLDLKIIFATILAVIRKTGG
ncbi:sugar transferase [bacterium]|nr:sugar transferase [bacterium]